MPSPLTGRRSRRTLPENPPNCVCARVNMETVRRRSKVWLNFTKINDKSARLYNNNNYIVQRRVYHQHDQTSHGVQITECPVFDALRRPSSVATSSAASTSGSDPHPSTALSGKLRNKYVNGWWISFSMPSGDLKLLRITPLME